MEFSFASFKINAMIDYARITVKAGNGGRGAGSFRKIKGKRYGKADGGDGGGGGNVYIEATGDLNGLEKYRFVKDYKAVKGDNGLSNHRKGAQGEDLVLRVPVGTAVTMESAGPARLHPTPTSSLSDSAVQSDFALHAAGARAGTMHLSPAVIYDLTNEGERALVARGGQGGRGNSHLRDEFGRRPRAGEPGQTGEQVNITLELKLIADVGLIGFPNAGKSTLISAITAAKPKIASYPFTTLEANLGVLEIEEDGAIKRIVLADIPGLIEGASQGRGLGDLFLKHIERTKMLAHLIDISQTGDLWATYNAIRKELKNYSGELTKKKELVVLSKADLVSKERIESVRKEFGRHRKKVVAISAQTAAGLDELVGAIAKQVSKISNY